MDPPPQSLQMVFRLPWTQIEAPLHVLHVARRVPCSHTDPAGRRFGRPFGFLGTTWHSGHHAFFSACLQRRNCRPFAAVSYILGTGWHVAPSSSSSSSSAAATYSDSDSPPSPNAADGRRAIRRHTAISYRGRT